MKAFRKIAGMLVIILLATGGAYAQSQPPIPSADENSSPPEKHAKNNHEAAKPTIGSTADSPLFVQVVNFPKPEGNIDVTANKGKEDARWITADQFTALFTGGIFLCGIFQLRLFRKTLLETRKAADATRDSADAVVAIELPILIIEGVDINMKMGGFAIRLGNHGRTPAIISSDYLTYKIAAKSLPIKPDYSEDSLNITPTIRVVEPKYECSVGRQFPITQEQWDSILKSDMILWVYGFVEYRDFLKIERRDGFCISIKPVPQKMYTTMEPSSVTWVQDGSAEYNYSKRKDECVSLSS